MKESTYHGLVIFDITNLPDLLTIHEESFKFDVEYFHLGWSFGIFFCYGR